ncbi:NAD(P)-binding protein [Phaeosphaeriaceae sp. SRC1lsM3a]|nr:NAD(P)-binding protein [Stagonospora sp. SRC1lsM3a]
MTSRYAEAHAHPQGPGDARPTALQIIKDNDLLDKLQGKVALITGVSSGIGTETAKALSAAGMHVFGAVRNLSKATEALGPHLSPGHLELLELDMSSLASVRACAAAFLSRSSQLHVLINNAGVMMTPFSLTADGFESQFGINHLAHFLLFQLLKPTLLASATPEYASRVICLSSVAHRTGVIDVADLTAPPKEETYDPVSTYARAKFANALTALEIERRYESRNLHAWAVMPGGIWSGLQDSLPKEVVEAWKGDSEFMKAWKSAEQGAATSVWAAVDKELEGKGGKYLEDCAVAGLASVDEDFGAPGYGRNLEQEGVGERLWDVSCEMVGVNED